MKGIFPDFAIGLGYSLDSHYDIHVKDAEAGQEFNLTMEQDIVDSLSSVKCKDN